MNLPRIDPVPGEPMRFTVDSESRRGMKFLVDLQANGLAGWCSCEDYEARRAKVQREQPALRTAESRCKHIVAAREWLLDKFLDSLAQVTGQPEEKIS
jgi:hypothetical protein